MNNEHTILIVDDEPRGRKTLEVLLMPQGYTLALAGDGPEALAKAAQLMPDVILLDVMMPGMDGFEVCRHLRANPILAEIPIIMVTALDDRDSRLQGIEAGADDFISKPFDRVELRTRIQTITKLNRYRRLLAERTKFEWVVEQADEGYLMVNDEQALLYANPQARRYLGLPIDDTEPISEAFLALAEKQYSLNPPDAWATWPNQAGTDPLYLVQSASSATGAFWLQVDRMSMDAQISDGYLVRLRNITTDVAKQRLIWSFHAQVSHKLRTPLGLVNGFLDLIEEDEDDYSVEEKLTIFSSISANTLQLRQKILDVFKYLDTVDMIKIGQGQYNITEILPIIDRVEANLGLKSIAKLYDETLTRLEHTQVPLSEETLEMILEEILKNAQKFHPDQSPSIEVKISGDEHAVYLQIADDGLTLSPEQLAKIWTPYYQAERYFSGQVPGMGLGLSMVASLVWSVGGTCQAYNRDNQPGIIVEIKLPLLSAEAIIEAYFESEAIS